MDSLKACCLSCQKCRDESHRSHHVCDVYKVAGRGKRKIEEALKKAGNEIVDCEDEMGTHIFFKVEENKSKRPAEMWPRIADELIKVLIAAEKRWLSNFKRMSFVCNSS